MSSWDSIIKEASQLNTLDAYDIILKQKIDAVQQITERHLVVYASDFMTSNPIKTQLVGNLVSISLTDKDGFDEVTRSLPQNSQVDILLHSPGGYAEATESIVTMLRSRFSKIRFIIPSVAKSAATMMAMSGEELLLDDCSELGPTDPQMMLTRDGHVIPPAPAQAILDQFEEAQREVNADPSKLPSWLPILREYGPSLLAQCRNSLALSRELVSTWLEQYMFSNEQDAALKARKIAEYLANHNAFRSHARRIGLEDLQSLDVKILDMRTQPILHDAVRDLYISIMLIFMNTGAYKLFMNDKHEAFVLSMNVQANNVAPQTQPQQQVDDKANEIILPRNRQEEKRLQHRSSKRNR